MGKQDRTKKGDFFVAYGFSYTPKHGKYKGQRITVGPGEPVPGEVIDNKDLLARLLDSERILKRGKDGQVKPPRKKAKIDERQIEMLVKEGDIEAIKRICASTQVGKDSLIRLRLHVERAKMPADVLQLIDRALER